MTHAPGTTASLYSEAAGGTTAKATAGTTRGRAPRRRPRIAKWPWRPPAPSLGRCGHASQLRAALQFDQRRMDPLEAARTRDSAWSPRSSRAARRGDGGRRRASRVRRRCQAMAARRPVLGGEADAPRVARRAAAAHRPAPPTAPPPSSPPPPPPLVSPRRLLPPRSWRKPVQETIKGVSSPPAPPLRHAPLPSHFVAWVRRSPPPPPAARPPPARRPPPRPPLPPAPSPPLLHLPSGRPPPEAQEAASLRTTPRHVRHPARNYGVARRDGGGARRTLYRQSVEVHRKEQLHEMMEKWATQGDAGGQFCAIRRNSAQFCAALSDASHPPGDAGACVARHPVGERRHRRLLDEGREARRARQARGACSTPEEAREGVCQSETGRRYRHHLHRLRLHSTSTPPPAPPSPCSVGCSPRQPRHLIVEWRKVIRPRTRSHSPAIMPFTPRNSAPFTGDQAEKQDLEACAPRSVPRVGLSRALTTWGWGATRAVQTERLPARVAPRRRLQVVHAHAPFTRNSSYSHPAFASSPSSCSSRGARPSSRTIGCATTWWSRCASRARSTRSATSASASRRRKSRGGRRCG